MTPAQLIASKEYAYSHTGSRRGYISRKTDGKVEEYAGRYGKGYIHIRPRWDSTQYVYIDYYLLTK